MKAPRLLRVIAIAIAVAGLADPSLTREMSGPQPVTIAVLDASGLAPAERLRADLDPDYDVTIQAHAAGAAPSACPAIGGCIIVSSGAAPERITAGAQVLGGLRVDDGRDQRHLTIAHLRSPGRVSLHGNALLDVQLRADSIRGDSEIQVFDDDVLVGAATYNWPDGRDGSSVVANVAVEWAPIGAGARRLRVRVTASDKERTIEDTADVGVDVRSEPVPILIYEPEATWLGTFVRRALEADARFRVEAGTRLGPAVTVSSGTSGPLSRAALAESGTVIVTAPGSLNAAEVALLERFARVRGGSVVIVLDRAPSGPVTRLLPPVAGERRAAEARGVGLLRASELVTFATAIGVTVLESADDRPVVVSRAMARGRVIASGALDAWRYRDAGFSRFWSALVADAASAAGEPLEIVLDQTILQPGVATGLTVEWRTMDEMPAAITARAELQCGDEPPVPVRLWPTGRAGRFRGAVSRDTGKGAAPFPTTTEKGASPFSEASGVACEVDAAITGPTTVAATAALLVTPDARFPGPDTAAFDGAVVAHGGMVVNAGEEAALVSRVHELLGTTRERRATWPMRSPWWLVPFAGCLGAEWWLRRRRGLR